MPDLRIRFRRDSNRFRMIFAGAAGLCLGVLTGGQSVQAQTWADCDALAAARGLGWADAVAGESGMWGRSIAHVMQVYPTIASATWIDAEHPHCRVEGFVATGDAMAGFNEVNFRILLPEDWNGKMYFAATAVDEGSGFDGFIPDLLPRLSRGYATVGTDTGHRDGSTFASWAQDNPTAVVDWAGRGVHVTAVAARQIIRSFYGQDVEYAYLEGCSGGGGQAMMSSQRYPEDFDGIIASAPTGAWSRLMLSGAWIMQRQLPNPKDLADATLPDAKVAYIGSRVYAICDALDGIADGILNDPRDCPFDPDIDLAICAPGNEAATNCLTREELDMYKAYLAGPSDAYGQIWPGFPVGGEIFLSPGGWSGWLGTFFAENPTPDNAIAGNATNQFVSEFFHHIAYPDNDDGSFDYRDFNFETDVPSLDLIAAIVDADDPNLWHFRENGGKLILTVGWNDHGVSAMGVIDYYERVLATLGDEETREFARLFLKPGVGHCNGGSGPDRADYLSALEDWVENGTPPRSIVAARVGQSGQVDMTRPLCPYPQVAQLIDPNGSTVDASNFECVEP